MVPEILIFFIVGNPTVSIAHVLVIVAVDAMTDSVTADAAASPTKTWSRHTVGLPSIKLSISREPFFLPNLFLRFLNHKSKQTSLGDVTDFIIVQIDCQSLTNIHLLEHLFSSSLVR